MENKKIKSNFPHLYETIENSKLELSLDFKKLFGIFGKYVYTVTIWQYLT